MTLLHGVKDYYYDVCYVDITFEHFAECRGRAASFGGSFLGGEGVRRLNRGPEAGYLLCRYFSLFFQSPQANS